ncbi:MAG: dihydroorotase [Burkholderiales bacterium]
MLDLVIRGATVVSAEANLNADVGIEGGTIVELAPQGATLKARETVDADGLWLMPGLVDAHVHLREPGLEHKEGFASGTRAAAAGGVTTVMVMPTDNPVTITPAHFIEKRALAERSAQVDFALQAGLGADGSHIPELVDLGAVSFEIFLADMPDALLIDNAEILLQLLTRIAACASIAGITPGDHGVVSSRTRTIRAISTGAAADFPGTRPPVSEALGVARACIAAGDTGARVHLRQLSCRAGASALAALRGGGAITAEVTPHNLYLDASALQRLGPFAKVGPPLRPIDDVRAMQTALQARQIDIVATDHAPHLPEEKRAGETDIWKAPSGLPGLQTFLPVMLKLVESGVIGINDLVRVCASEPARIFGLQCKGRIATGMDADLILLNPRATFQVRNEDQLSKSRITPFAGLETRGRLDRVFLRGCEILRDGKLISANKGKFISPRR